MKSNCYEDCQHLYEYLHIVVILLEINTFLKVIKK